MEDIATKSSGSKNQITNTLYSLEYAGDVLTLKGSDGSASAVTISTQLSYITEAMIDALFGSAPVSVKGVVVQFGDSIADYIAQGEIWQRDSIFGTLEVVE